MKGRMKSSIKEDIKFALQVVLVAFICVIMSFALYMSGVRSAREKAKDGIQYEGVVVGYDTDYKSVQHAGKLIKKLEHFVVVNMDGNQVRLSCTKDRLDKFEVGSGVTVYENNGKRALFPEHVYSNSLSGLSAIFILGSVLSLFCLFLLIIKIIKDLLSRG